MYLRSIDNPSTGANGLLPVENINSKILFLSGEADNLWPSTLMGQRLEQQLKNKGKTNTITHVSYPKVGHAIVGASQALLKKENQIFLGGELEASKIVEQKAFSMILKTLN